MGDEKGRQLRAEWEAAQRGYDAACIATRSAQDTQDAAYRAKCAAGMAYWRHVDPEEAMKPKPQD
ncbi:MAG: hypothetical protein IMZ50_12155 [Candidatus Atribacteria bacterium]|nr:hypothetical protein [Candidatus Atribacteria bacterium]